MDMKALSEIVGELRDRAVTYMDYCSGTVRSFDGADEDARRAVVEMLPAASQIAAALNGTVDPSELETEDIGEGQFNFARRVHDAAVRMAGHLRFQAEITEALRADEPEIESGSLHPWVWEAAESLWSDGYRRNAIHAAADQIDTRLQAKLGREDISGKALVAQAFTLDDAAPGRPRLRFKNVTPGSEAYNSAHEGAMHFGMGCFQLIRNSAVHRPRRVADHVLVEHLASLSLLARLIEFADLVEVEAVDDERTPHDFGDDPFG